MAPPIITTMSQSTAPRTRSLLRNSDDGISSCYADSNCSTASQNTTSDPPPKRNSKKRTKEFPLVRRLLIDKFRASLSMQLYPSSNICEVKSNRALNVDEVLESPKNAQMFRVEVNELKYTLKIHKFEYDSINEAMRYPKPNPLFDHESLVYARLARLQSLPDPPISKYCGYIKLNKLSPLPSTSTRFNFPRQQYSRSYITPRIDARTGEEKTRSETEMRWKKYFRNPARQCILQGMLFETDEGRCWMDGDKTNRVLARWGKEGLMQLHVLGVVVGDPENLTQHVRIIGDRVIWTDFSIAEFHTGRAEDYRSYWKKAAQEIEQWSRLFNEKET